MQRILVIGAGGQVGWELLRTLAPLGTVLAADREGAPLRADLGDADALRALVREVKPSVIVNAAAYTAVDRAEEDEATAAVVNGSAPGLLAEEAKAHGALLVHYSTDYVFDGSKGRPYLEEDVPAPLNAYGRTKLSGEQAVAAVDGDHLVLRTAWVYGLRGQNFLRTMLRLGHERELLRVVDDQRGVPNWSRMLAEATAQLVLRGRDGGRWRPELSGLYHLSAGGETSWCGFAARILAWAGGRGPGPVARVEPIPSREYPTPAARPAAAVLDCGRLEAAFGLRLPSWEDALDLCLADLAAAADSAKLG